MPAAHRSAEVPLDVRPKPFATTLDTLFHGALYGSVALTLFCLAWALMAVLP
jgi:hypothetical protein